MIWTSASWLRFHGSTSVHYWNRRSTLNSNPSGGLSSLANSIGEKLRKGYDGSTHRPAGHVSAGHRANACTIIRKLRRAPGDRVLIFEVERREIIERLINRRASAAMSRSCARARASTPELFPPEPAPAPPPSAGLPPASVPEWEGPPCKRSLGSRTFAGVRR